MNQPQNATDLLEAVSELEVPELETDTLDRIEAGLRAHITSSPTTLHRPTPVRYVARPLRSAAAIAAAVAALLAGLFLVTPDEQELEFTSAEGVTVELPDGTRHVGHTGDKLLDGTVIEVGANGYAVVDGTRLGPGDSYRVEGRELVRVDEPRAPISASQGPRSPEGRADANRVPAEEELQGAPATATTSVEVPPTLQGRPSAERDRGATHVQPPGRPSTTAPRPDVSEPPPTTTPPTTRPPDPRPAAPGSSRPPASTTTSAPRTTTTSEGRPPR